MDFASVKAGLEDKSFVLIDVRGADEIKEAGKIPGSQNVPLNDIPTAFGLSDEEFKSKYGFDKPAKDAAIVTSCKIGGRAAKGGTMLENLGFTNVKVYGGSFTDWQKNNGPTE